MSWLIPVTFALGLWGANWLLMWLARYPIEFVGIPPFLGWQGVIPRNVESVSTRIAHSLTTRLASVEEVLECVIDVIGRSVTEEVWSCAAPILADDPMLFDAFPCCPRAG